VGLFSRKKTPVPDSLPAGHWASCRARTKAPCSWPGCVRASVHRWPCAYPSAGNSHAMSGNGRQRHADTRENATLQDLEDRRLSRALGWSEKPSLS